MEEAGDPLPAGYIMQALLKTNRVYVITIEPAYTIRLAVIQKEQRQQLKQKQL